MLAQKMRVVGKDDVVDEVFVPIPDSPSEYILGPSFKMEIPLYLSGSYPLVEGEKLLLHSSIPDCSKARTIRSWPVVNKVWTDWVDRIQKVKGDVWKSAGIYDAIQLSRMDIPMHKNLLYAALCFWSMSSNAFHFKFGMMGPTVFDIVALTGLRPHGEEVSALLDVPKFDYSFPKDEEGKDILAYWKFVEASMGETSVTDNEHIAFLALWLCKFLFCNASVKMTKEYVQLAIALATGRKLAIAPLVLSHLYRGCRDITTSKFGHAGGPFWILQLWLLSYFPEYRSSSFDETSAPTYGFPLAQSELQSKSFNECLEFFYSCSSRTDAQFLPFSCRTSGPEWCKLDPSLPTEDREVHDIWASYLIPRDLHYSLAVGKRVKNKCGVEYYAPNQFARQFGLTQAVPLPPYRTANDTSNRRAVFKSADEIRDIHLTCDQLRQKFLFVNFKENPKTTKFFNEWWSSYIAATQSEPIDCILGKIASAVAPLPSPAKQEIVASESSDSHNFPWIFKKRVRKGETENQDSTDEEQEQPCKRTKANSKGLQTPQAKSSGKSVTTSSKKRRSTLSVAVVKVKPDAVIPYTNTTAEPVDQEYREMNNQEDRQISTLPLSAEIGGKCSTIVEYIKEPVKLESMDDLYAPVTGQPEEGNNPNSARGESACTFTKDSTKSSANVKALAKVKVDIKKLLSLPSENFFLPENQSALSTLISTYATSPDLSPEKKAALEKLKRSIPSLCSTYNQAKEEKSVYYKKATKKIVLIDRLTKDHEVETYLKQGHKKLVVSIKSMKAQIKDLKLSLREAKMKKKANEEQQRALLKACHIKSAALEEMEPEFRALEEKKQQADSDAAQVDAALAEFKSEIFGTEELL